MADTVNGARGERTFRAGGRDVTVLFTNRALANSEKRLGRGIVAVAQGMGDGSSGITEIAVLLHVGMEAARLDRRDRGRPYSMDDAYKVLDRAGFAAVASPVMEAVAAVLGYAADEEESTEDPEEVEAHDPNE